jgi:anti-sigma regulatory factor (Ser/Thr protein kinase)
VCTWSPDPGEYGRRFTRRVPANQHGIRPLRGAIGVWLDGIGAGDDTKDAVVLSLWEALTNAVEHGSFPGDQITLSLAASLDGALVAEIHDQGRLRPNADQPHRGLGMVLMRALMDNVELTNDELGTTVRMRLVPVS